MYNALVHFNFLSSNIFQYNDFNGNNIFEEL